MYLDWDISAIDWKIIGLDWDIADLEWKIIGLDWDISDLDWKITGFDWDIADYHWKIVGLFGDIAELLSGFLNTTVTSVNTPHKQHATRISSLSATLSHRGHSNHVTYFSVTHAAVCSTSVNTHAQANTWSVTRLFDCNGNTCR